MTDAFTVQVCNSGVGLLAGEVFGVPRRRTPPSAPLVAYFTLLASLYDRRAQHPSIESLLLWRDGDARHQEVSLVVLEADEREAARRLVDEPR